MPSTPRKPADQTKRRARTIQAGDAINKILDPAFRKRGFATRDIVAYWRQIAPENYCDITMPDRLNWPRGEAGAEGARLYLRCLPGRTHEVEHDAPKIVEAINRYFGYFLVGSVRLSNEPFTPRSVETPQKHPHPDARQRDRIDSEVAKVGDSGLQEALRLLGVGISSRKR